MKKIIILLLITLCLFTNILVVKAHPGRTDSSGCHTCRTNCAKWGLSTGQYHCHNAKSAKSKNTKTVSKSKAQKTTSKAVSRAKPINKKVVKDGNASLNKVWVDGYLAKYYKGSYYIDTYSDSAMVRVNASSYKAQVDYDNYVNLNSLVNVEYIKVTAENGSVKTYKLVIKKISKDVGICKLKVGKKSVEIGSETSFNIVNTSKKKALRIVAVPCDESSKLYEQNDITIKKGDNKLKFRVVSTDGSIKDYVVNLKSKNKKFAIITVDSKKKLIDTRNVNKVSKSERKELRRIIKVYFSSYYKDKKFEFVKKSWKYQQAEGIYSVSGKVKGNEKFSFILDSSFKIIKKEIK